ncbi:UDP-N-acetylmuramate dehydrogenase [Endozoicomonas numazuensis]|uniref:UDP-N-acetylenolpyruvoylglucosamine reductase n=1 Tax=Endozoicomonas numazuensis TaxID=1137799 RepID=A0A081N422_9GAMM|nr:UDP-N-acetylmuramate dehydrogenase [Endozoicomonas numazuensis]KEQ13195.1 UDP-N-acetylenolpyruvoylglucosamine reductase [Endozoicomonas numazuensis]
MRILENYSLEALNTFGFRVNARYFAEASSVEDLREAVHFACQKNLPVVPLGGGSNLILSGDQEALFVHVNICDKEVVSRGDELVRVTAGAGENWHEFVRWTLGERAFGLENLSLIPGNVGAAPIQNIGAYGVEIKDFLHSLDALDMKSGELKTFSLADCQFGYRDSIFKHSARDRFIITFVEFALDAKLSPRLAYGRLQEEVEQRSEGSPDAFVISEAVCDIRMEKLPDPRVLGNAGSFFKNPVVGESLLKKLQADYPDIVAFPFEGRWKLAAGWLIDRAGLKGFRQGAVGTFNNQALVLVNHGGAVPEDLLGLAQYIQDVVRDRFGVELEMEPRVY